MRLTRVLVLLAMCIALPPMHFAQTNYIVVPNDKEHSFGNSFAAISRFDFQQLYSPTHFSSITNVIAITGLGLRWSEDFNGTNDITISSVQLQMGTCTVSSLDFEQNLGPNPVRVFSGTNVTFPGRPNRSPEVFDLEVIFQKPFYYHPSAGLLVLQGDNLAEGWDADAEQGQVVGGGYTIYRRPFPGNVTGSSTVVVTKFYYTFAPRISSLSVRDGSLWITYFDPSGRGRVAAADTPAASYVPEPNVEIVPVSSEYWEAKVQLPQVPRFYRIILQ